MCYNVNMKNSHVTLMKAVAIFKDDLQPVLDEKIAVLKPAIKARKFLLEMHQTINHKEFAELMRENNIDLKEWDLYQLLYSMIIRQQYPEIRENERILEGHVKELKNIENAQNILRAIKDGGDLFDIELAKNYPIEKMFPTGLIKSGKYKKGICPFHEDKDPSLVIYPGNTFFCFGCHEHGDAIDFYMKLKNVSFAVAVRDLQ